MKEEEDTTKEAFNRTALAQFLFRPSGWQAGTVLLSFGVPGDDGAGVQRGMDPGDEAQAPIGGIQADHARVNRVETHGPFQQWASKGGIMDIGRGEQEEEGQARAATEQGMHAIAA
jgi:hypothetical protein